MLKIWGHRQSSCVKKAIWCAEELGLSYEQITVGGGHGGLDDPTYVAMNPNRVIPTIDDDGFILWESSAIMTYLAAKHGQGTIYPDDVRQRGEAYRWIHWQGNVLRPLMLPLFVEWVGMEPQRRHLDSLEQKRRGMEGPWRILDDHLAGRDFVAGADFSMGDIPIGIMANWWYAFPIDHFELPNMEAWYARLRARPAFQKAIVEPGL